MRSVSYGDRVLGLNVPFTYLRVGAYIEEVIPIADHICPNFPTKVPLKKISCNVIRSM